MREETKTPHEAFLPISEQPRASRWDITPWFFGLIAVSAVVSAAAIAIGDAAERPQRAPGTTVLDNAPLETTNSILRSSALGSPRLGHAALASDGAQVASGAGVQPATVSYLAPMNLSDSWSATGLMGDGKAPSGEYLQLDLHSEVYPRVGRDCVEVKVNPGPTGWAGLYWLSGPKDWGSTPGLDLSGYHRVTFWARGETGAERIEFRAGGIDATRDTTYRYRDSFERGLNPVELSTQWLPYEIDLTGAELTSVIGAFGWLAKVEDNPQGAVFYLDQIRYE